MGKIAYRAIKNLNTARNFFRWSSPPRTSFVFYKTLAKGNDITLIEDPSKSTIVELPKKQARNLLHSSHILPQKETHLVVESIRILEPQNDEPKKLMDRIFRGLLIKPNGVLIVDEFSELRGCLKTSGRVSIHKSKFGWGTYYLEETFLKDVLLEGNGTYRMAFSNNGLSMTQFLAAISPRSKKSIEIKYGKIVNSYISINVNGLGLNIENSYIGSHTGKVLEGVRVKDSVIPDGRITKPNEKITGIMHEEKILFESLVSSDIKKAIDFVQRFIKDSNPIQVKDVIFEGKGKHISMAVAIALLIEDRNPELVRNIFLALKDSEADGVIKLLDKLKKVARFVGPLAEEVIKRAMSKIFWYYNSIGMFQEKGVITINGKTMRALEKETQERIFPKMKNAKIVPV